MVAPRSISGAGSITGSGSINGASGGGGTVSTYFSIPSHTNESHFTYANSGGTVTAVSYNSSIGTLSITWSGPSADPLNGYNVYLFPTANPGPLNGPNEGSIVVPEGYQWLNDAWDSTNQAISNGDGSVTFTANAPALIADSGSGLITAVIRNSMYNPATPLIRFVE
jgi:hypothetical protein